MKCLKCKHRKYFLSFFNQDVKVKYDNSEIKYVKRDEPKISDIYPLICGKCQSEDVDFDYTELEKIVAAGRRFPTPEKYSKPII